MQRIGFSGKQAMMAAVIAGALVLAVWSPAVLTLAQARILAVVLVTLGFWASGVVPSYFASLVLFAVVLVLGLAPADLVFAGFGSTAVWLIVSGFVIGAAISASGLGRVLAQALAPVLDGSYARMIFGLTLVAMVLGFVMPSSVGRAVVLVPIGMALADRAGFAPGSNGRIGIAVTLAIACNMPSFAILPANIPNMVLSGAAETIYGTHFGYMGYLLLHYPVLGLAKSAVTAALVLRMFPAEVAAQKVADTKVTAPADRSAQLRVAAVLLLTLLLWMTDALHGVNAAWVGLAAAVVLLSPGFGVVSPQAFKAAVDFGLLLFVVGALAVGALVNASGLGALIGQGLQAVLPLHPGATAGNFAALSLMSMLTGVLTTVPSVPSVLTPMAEGLSQASGFDLPAVLMTQVVGFSTVLLPYQVAPLVVAMGLSGEKVGSLARVLLRLAAVTLLLLLPLDYLWWRLLGWI
ncbi:SLC13 family permease [Cypionkella sinensis]|uniref:SLC13 family permease n=1 Tax=Cypionkella sinensis TaxID=1756043 RepID=A0ABV7IUR9_9RHOB